MVTSLINHVNINKQFVFHTLNYKKNQEAVATIGLVNWFLIFILRRWSCLLLFCKGTIFIGFFGTLTFSGLDSVLIKSVPWIFNVLTTFFCAKLLSISLPLAETPTSVVLLNTFLDGAFSCSTMVFSWDVSFEIFAFFVFALGFFFVALLIIIVALSSRRILQLWTRNI